MNSVNYPRHLPYAERRKRQYARERLFEAVLQGKVAKGTCEAEGEHKGRICGHHRNGYDDALDVVWLCIRHHNQEHAAMRRASKGAAA